MSEGFTPPPPEEDALPALKIALFGLAALAIFALGLIGFRLIQHYTAHSPEFPRPPIYGEAEVGMVFQTPFNQGSSGIKLRAEQTATLNQFRPGTDGGAGRMPISDAIAQIAAAGGRDGGLP